MIIIIIKIIKSACTFSTLFRTIANYNYVRILIRIIKFYINSTKNRDNEEKFLSQLSSSSEGIPTKAEMKNNETR